LESWEIWKDYRFPDPKALWRWDKTALTTKIEESRRFKKYIIGKAGNLFEKIQWLRGFSNTMIDIAENRFRIKLLCEKITEYILATVDELAKLKVDGIIITDDWGTQEGLMISPVLWREIFKPYYKIIFNRIHQNSIDVHFHTDGNTTDIIPDLIEIGVNVLNPQISALNLEELGKLVRHNICIRTDIDRQYMLIRATSGEMDQYVKKVLNLMGSEKGGIIGCGELNSYCSLIAVEAMYKAFEKYGRYF